MDWYSSLLSSGAGSSAGSSAGSAGSSSAGSGVSLGGLLGGSSGGSGGGNQRGGAGRSEKWGMLGQLYQQYLGNAGKQRQGDLTPDLPTMMQRGESGVDYTPTAGLFANQLPVSSAYEQLRRMGYV